MSRASVSVLFLLLLHFALAAPSARAAQAAAAADAEKKPAAPKVLLETWQAAYFEGLKAGHTHTVATQTGSGASARIRTVRDMHLVIKRYRSVQEINITQSSEEKPDGTVLSLGLSFQIGKSPKLVLTGKVEEGGKKLTLRRGDTPAVSVPFDPATLGIYAQEAVFQRKKVKPDDKLTILAYELAVPSPLTIRATVKQRENVDQLALEKDSKGKVGVVRKPASLLRVETEADPIKVGGDTVQLPRKLVWLDAKLMPAREQFEQFGLGTITLYTTTKEAALKEGVAPERMPDFGLNINIPVKQTIDDPYRTREAAYRITLKEKIATRAFSQDERQTVRNARGNSFELHVKAIRRPGTDDRATPPGKEFLSSNLFIDSDDPAIQKLARGIVKKEADPWKKALLLEKWVHDNMKVSTAVGFPSASRIARDLEGDCRQHGLLLAALARAAGIPSRTAVGLIYVRERGRSPHFSFHMWAEVWVKGRWVALDAVLGEGGVAATHLKIGDHSWSETATLAPLLPIAQVLGKIQIEVLSSK